MTDTPKTNALESIEITDAAKAIANRGILASKTCRPVAEAMLAERIQWRLDPNYILTLCDAVDFLVTSTQPAPKNNLTMTAIAAVKQNIIEIERADMAAPILVATGRTDIAVRAGRAVTLIDADPNQPLATWSRRFEKTVPENLRVTGGVNQETIIETIEKAAARDPFVIVDLEGSANMTASYAISRADLVLIPMRGKQLDADQAGRVVSLIERETKAFRRKIDYRVVFSMTANFLTREMKHIRSTLEERGIPILPASLAERAPYSAMFQIGGTIFDLTDADVSNTKGAIADARKFAAAVIAVLQEQQEKAA